MGATATVSEDVPASKTIGVTLHDCRSREQSASTGVDYYHSEIKLADQVQYQNTGIGQRTFGSHAMMHWTVLSWNPS